MATAAWTTWERSACSHCGSENRTSPAHAHPSPPFLARDEPSSNERPEHLGQERGQRRTPSFLAQNFLPFAEADWLEPEYEHGAIYHMSFRVIAAVDPGASGGIAVSLGGMVSVWPMPDTEGGALNLLRGIAAETGGEPLRAVVEEVGGYMGDAQPASRAFTFGRNFGVLLGVLMALDARVELVRPQKWQQALGLGYSGRTRVPAGANDEERKKIRAFNARAKTEWKRRLKQKAEQLFPGVNVTLKTCDALLILEYSKRTEQQP
jgi:hypothetical protein